MGTLMETVIEKEAANSSEESVVTAQNIETTFSFLFDSFYNFLESFKVDVAEKLSASVYAFLDSKQ